MKPKSKQEIIEDLELRKSKVNDPVIKASIDNKIKALTNNTDIKK